MTIKSFGNKIVIEGNIKSIVHFNELKSAIDAIRLSDHSIVIEIIDSMSITSSVIGYLSKLVNVDGMRIEMYVKNDNLYDLLEDLGLVQMFNVRRMS